MGVKLLGLLVGLALVLVACGGGDNGAPALATDDVAGGDENLTSAACLVGEPVCEDTVPDTDQPTDPPRPGVPVATVVSAQIDGGFAIEGFYFADDGGVRLCESLAESFPPQCGGASIDFDNSTGADLGTLSIEQGVTWSDQPILVVGSVVEGVFVAE